MRWPQGATRLGRWKRHRCNQTPRRGSQYCALRRHHVNTGRRQRASLVRDLDTGNQCAHEWQIFLWQVTAVTVQGSHDSAAAVNSVSTAAVAPEAAERLEGALLVFHDVDSTALKICHDYMYVLHGYKYVDYKFTLRD